MLKLARSKGEKIEIEGCALIRVGKIEEARVRIDVTAPFSAALRAEDAAHDALNGRCVEIRLMDIYRRGPNGLLRSSIGIRVPEGGKARRAEVSHQTTPPEMQFPWQRFQPTARFWRSVNESIVIPLPAD